MAGADGVEDGLFGAWSPRSSYESLRTSGTRVFFYLVAIGFLVLLHGNRHIVANALGLDAVYAEHDVPFAGEEVATDVAGRRVVVREEELRARGAAPAAEASGLRKVVAARVKDADIDDVARAIAERRGHRIGVAVRDVNARGVLRDVEGEVKVGVLPDLLRRYVALDADRFCQSCPQDARPPSTGCCQNITALLGEPWLRSA